jgi:conjugative relaxase-like TrwC/TraI family protein
VLSIGTVSAGNAAQREYHERQLAQSRDDYYRESEGPPGMWVGAAAERMGLEGEVTVEAFRAMLEGQDPTTGDSLGGGMDRRKTLAFDLAFSAPKSVSLMRMAADEPTSKRIDQAHERAVTAALAYIEQEGWKGRQRIEREDGTKERVTFNGTGVVGVLYRHETTRNADPQLHSHAVLANVVHGEQGGGMAINSPVLYAQAKTAGSVYQAVLRGELGRELGVEFDSPVNGLADIKGFDRQLIETFSTRRAEILKRLDDLGLSAGSKVAAERVALDSRRAKDMGLDHHVWRGEVRDALAAVGFGREQARTFTRPEREVVAVGDRLATAPLGSIADKRATEDARPIRQAAMNVAAGYTADEVGEALERAFHDERVVQVRGGKKPRWTTAEHLRLEERVHTATVARAAETTAPKISEAGYAVPTKTPDGHALSGEQCRVLEHVLTSGRGVEVIRARAGAGKTTIAGIARGEFERHGLRVVGVAPTLQALAELDDVGLEQRETLARTSIADGDVSTVMRTMDHSTVVLVDEAGMSQTKDIAPLLRRAQERGAKVVAIGDDVQLAAVGAGGWFRYLAEHQDVEVLELTEIHRQCDPVERAHLNQMHRGDVAGWTRWADQHGRIAVAPTVEGAYDEAVRRYGAGLDVAGGDVDRVVVMAPQNSHRRILNEQLRRVAVDRGIVDRDGQQDFGGLLVAPGERLVATCTVVDPITRQRTVENGERFEVLSVDASGARARAVAGGRRGQTVTLPASVLTPGGDRRTIDHAYARTVHKAQGVTVDRSVLFSPDPTQLGLNLAYVGMTRTRERADLVTVAPNRATGLRRLVRGMSERRDHQAALAILHPDRLTPERLGTMGDRELDEHRHALLTEAREAMGHLGRLDREARGAWTTSGETRTDAHLLAQRDRLAASIDEREQHLAEVDPDGDRQRRGLMEHAMRQGIDRDRKTVEGLDRQLEGRRGVDIDAADAEQARIRAEREPVRAYVEQLLEGLDQVHGQQIDRSTRTPDPLSVRERERPTLALRAAAERQERVHELALSAAQQLGAGHPLVSQWIERHTPTVRPAAAPERDAGRPQFTPAQQAFADALQRCHDAAPARVRAGGRRELQVLDGLAQRTQDAERRRADAIRARGAHLEREPSRLRRGAHPEWEQLAEVNQQRVAGTDLALEQLDQERRAMEDRHGKPLRDVIQDLRADLQRVSDAARAATAAERALVALGRRGLAPRLAERLLGRRDTLQAPDQRRYDELAGRMSVDQVLTSRAPADRADRCTPIRPRPVEQDLAIWRRDHDLPLTDRQRQTLDRPVPNRGRDAGPDYGR